MTGPYEHHPNSGREDDPERQEFLVSRVRVYTDEPINPHIVKVNAYDERGRQVEFEIEAEALLRLLLTNKEARAACRFIGDLRMVAPIRP